MILLCSPPREPRDRRLLQSGAGPPVPGLRRGRRGLPGQLGRVLCSFRCRFLLQPHRTPSSSKKVTFGLNRNTTAGESVSALGGGERLGPSLGCSRGGREGLGFQACLP